MNELQIARPQSSDFPAIYKLIHASFADDPNSDHSEQDLVKRLIHSSAFIPELCLCAYIDNTPAGFILVTRVYIEDSGTKNPYLSLAPVCVSPDLQKSGIGSALIRKAHKVAEKLGEPGIVLIGHNSYYPRFGYEKALDYGVTFPFEIPSQYCMIKVLSGVPPKGVVTYPKEFYG